MAEAGWYPDPQDPSSEAFFDGQNWTGQRRPVAPRTPEPTQPSQPATPQWTAPAPQWGGYQPAPAQVGYPTQTYPTQAYPGPGYPGWQPPATPPARRRRKPMVIALVAVVVVAAGLVTWLVWPSSSPQFTYQGKAIASPAKVLTAAEANVQALVKARHGAAAQDARCYFAQPVKPASGAKKSDVAPALRCGPVLFVDGDQAKAYLAVPFTSTTKDGKATLSPQATLTGLQPAAVPSDVKLGRPDGKSAPSGSGGLKVPQPPPATKDVLTTATLGPTAQPQTLQNARIVGKDSGVRLEAAGVIARYGSGDDARSAPPGEKLIAFQVSPTEGDVTDAGTAQPQVVVPGTAARTVPDTTGGDEWVILAAPASATPLLQLTDGGYKQTLTLPDGKPGANNLAVLARAHRTQVLAFKRSVPIHLSEAGNSADTPWHASATFASLDYWIPGHEAQHARDPQSAVLSVLLSYTDPDQPGKTFGFDPAMLQLKVPGGGTLHARNVATGNHIFDVFDVPATFTGGTVEITGSETVQGITVAVGKTVSFAVAFQAG